MSGRDKPSFSKFFLIMLLNAKMDTRRIIIRHDEPSAKVGLVRRTKKLAPKDILSAFTKRSIRQIGHFRITFCLGVKTSFRAKPVM